MTTVEEMNLKTDLINSGEVSDSIYACRENSPTSEDFMRWSRNRLHIVNTQMHSIMEGIRTVLMPKQ